MRLLFLVGGSTGSSESVKLTNRRQGIPENSQ
jgi:hypothetical protein